MNPSIIAEFREFKSLGHRAALGISLETILLFCILLNTMILSLLLHKTKRHLSTATILFIFNILFSNFLFVASFVCLFSGMLFGDGYSSSGEQVWPSGLHFFCHRSGLLLIIYYYYIRIKEVYWTQCF